METCVEWDVLNKFCFMHHLTFFDLGNFWNQKSVTVIHLKDLQFSTRLHGLNG